MLHWPEQDMASIPREYVGQARALRNKLLECDATTNTLVDTLTKPALARHRRYPIPRAEQLSGLRRAWVMHMPDFGLLNRAIEHDKRSLKIMDVRAGGNSFKARGWRDTEPGISVHVLRLEIRAHVFKCSVVSLCSISLHAAARRIERHPKRSEADVLSACHDLALAHGKIDESWVGEDFEIPTDGGQWVGLVAKFDGNLILMTRTFIE